MILSPNIRQSRWLLALPLLAWLGACVGPTPYQAGDGTYGYSEQQIEDNRYRVTFSGNPSTSRETVQDYLLYRAAELTVTEGFDYFTVVNQDVERSTRYYSQGYVNDLGSRSRFSRRGKRRFYRPSFYSSNTYPVSEYSSILNIVMVEGTKPKTDSSAYDALDVLMRLQPLIRQNDQT